jgi:ABC-type transport system involved in multi-copper enzyme maturation permease subunit
MAALIRIIAVAQTTFRETIRNKIMLNMLGFAAAMLGISWVVSNWSIGEPQKVTLDLGLTVTVFTGVVIALFTGIVLVYGEVDRRTILPVLAKPLARWEFLAGKFFGFSAAVLLVYAGMNLILILLMLAIGRPPDLGMLTAMYLSAWEVELVVALALLFSAFSTPSLSALYTIMLFVAGRFSGDIKLFVENHPEAASTPILKASYLLIPHLSAFNLRREAVHSLEISPGQIWYPTIYGILYISIMLIIAMMVFRNRDLA